jgi:thymidine phosphorylase
VRDVPARRSGYVQDLGAVQVGNAALRLGAGRRDKDDAIDHAVGVICCKKRGDAVHEGESLADVHANDDASAERAVADVLAAYDVGETPPPERGVILAILAR